MCVWIIHLRMLTYDMLTLMLEVLTLPLPWGFPPPPTYRFALRLSLACLLQYSARLVFCYCGYGYWMSYMDIRLLTSYSLRFFLGSILIIFSSDSIALKVSFINLNISNKTLLISYIWQVAQLFATTTLAGLITKIFLNVSIASLKFPSYINTYPL